MSKTKDKLRKLQLSDLLDISSESDESYSILEELNGTNTELVVDLNNKLESFLLNKVDGSYFQALLVLYQSSNVFWKSFAIQYFPSIVSLYLTFTGRKQLVDVSKVENILFSIYKLESTRNAVDSNSKSFKIPSLSNPSVYHEPQGMSYSVLTESLLSRHEQSNKAIHITEPKIPSDTFSFHLRSVVLKCVLQIYNRKISSMSEVSHVAFCKMVARFATSFFPPTKSNENILKVISLKELEFIKDECRVCLSQDVISEMIYGLQFIMYNGCAEMATAAIECLMQVQNRTRSTTLQMNLSALRSSLKESSDNPADPILPQSPHHLTRRQTAFWNRRCAISSSVLASTHQKGQLEEAKSNSDSELCRSDEKVEVKLA